jgi:tetratricopeptide (TPR) repeat protein
MGGGASRIAKHGGKYGASRELINEAEALRKKVESRELNLSEEATIKLETALSQENDPPTAMPLQETELVRLTSVAVAKHVKTAIDQMANLLPGDLAEIIEIAEDGTKVEGHAGPFTCRGRYLHVRGPDRPELAKFSGSFTDYWYKIDEMERPPPSWSMMGQAELKMGVGDREYTSAGGRAWEGASRKKNVAVEIDTLTATKSKHYKQAVWSSDRTAVRERAIAEENVEFAHNYMNNGKFDAALDCLERALDYHPDRAMVHATRGSCFVFVEELEDALREYERACVLSPEDGAYWRGSGMANFYLGRSLQAEHGDAFTGTNPHLRKNGSISCCFRVPDRHLSSFEWVAFSSGGRGAACEGRGAGL